MVSLTSNEKWIFLQLLVLSLLLPSLDTLCDLLLCVKLVQAKHRLWALGVALPVLLTWLFTLAAWHRCPRAFCGQGRLGRCLEWTALLLQVTQYTPCTHS